MKLIVSVCALLPFITDQAFAESPFRNQTIVICEKQRVEGSNYSLDFSNSQRSLAKDGLTAHKASYVVNLTSKSATVVLGTHEYDAVVVSAGVYSISVSYGQSGFSSLDTIFPDGTVVTQFNRMLTDTYFSTYTMVSKCVID